MNQCDNDVKRSLKAVWYCQQQINRKMERRARLRSLAEKTTACWSLTPPATGGGGGMEGAAVKLMDMERELERDVETLRATIKAAQIYIGTLDSFLERAVLEMRYIDNMKFEEIAEKLNYSLPHVFTIHAAGLRHLREITDTTGARLIIENNSM